MSDAKGNQEPSMEEILASIRRIISEDGEPKDEAAAPAVNGHAATEEDDDDDALSSPTWLSAKAMWLS